MSIKSCALIISTYNRSNALQRVLESVLQQSVQPTNIIIADDGSDNTTRNLIDSFKNGCKPQQLIHVWQPDEGFRVARIRNKALRAARGVEYIIQIDGDMVLHPLFIADHLAVAQQGYFIRGNKYMLSVQETQQVLTHGNDSIHTFSIPLGKAQKAKRIPLLRNIYNALNIDIKGVFGSNMGYWLHDAEAINGYDNSFSGWGSEDDDFADRLRMLGVKSKSIKFGAIAYHLHHPNADRSSVEYNHQLRTQHTSQKITRTINGITETPDNEE